MGRGEWSVQTSSHAGSRVSACMTSFGSEGHRADVVGWGDKRRGMKEGKVTRRCRQEASVSHGRCARSRDHSPGPPHQPERMGTQSERVQGRQREWKNFGVPPPISPLPASLPHSLL